MRLHRRFRLVLVAAGAGALVVAIAAVALPEVLEVLLVRRLEARLRVPVHVGDVDFNLFTGRGRVTDLVAGGDAAAPEPLVRIPTLDLEVSYRALLRRDVVLHSLTVHGPVARIVRTGPASFNVLEALAPGEGGPAAEWSIRFARIEGGRVHFVDRTESPPLERILRNLRLTARHVSTLPGHERPADFRFGFRVADGTVVVRGEARPFADPTSVELVAELRRVDPSLFEAYLPPRPRVDLSGGRLSADLRYVLQPDEEPARHVVSGRLEMGRVAVLPAAGEEPAVAVAGITAADVRLDLRANTLRAGTLVLHDPSLRLVRGPGGALDLGGLWGEDRAGGDKAGEPPGDGGGGLDVAVDEVRVESGRLAFVDRSTEPDFEATLEQIGLVVTDLGLAEPAGPAKVQADGRLGSARLRVSGRLDPRPVEGRLEVRVDDVPLELFEPYANAALGAASTRRGRVDARLALLLSPGPPGAGPALAVTGSLVGTGLAFGLPDRDPALLAASRLAVDLERLSVLPELAASVNAVELSEARLRVVIDEEGRLNLSRLWADGEEDGGEGEVRAEEPSDAGPPPVSIDRITLRDGQLTVIDRRVEPTFTAVLKDVTVNVRDLGGTNPRSRVELKGTLGHEAPLRIAGWVTPFGRPLSLRLEASLDGYELTGLRPYPEEYLGYRVRRGRLSADLEYRYEGGRLRGENALVIRRLMLGEKLDDRFRDRIGLSLPFAVELLERPGGDIRLRFPLSGNLPRPEVGVAGIVRDALRNGLVKALAAPLRLIGNVVTRAGRIGQVRTEPIPFLPGTITPDPDAVGRLAGLVDLLQRAPRLELEIAGLAAREEADDLAREGEEPATEADLRELARRRAHVVEEMLIARGIDGSRLFVAEPGPHAMVAEAPGGARLRILR